jgi:hypothetical protein
VNPTTLESILSIEYSFKTAPKAGDFPPFRVAVYGDLGLVNGDQTRKVLLNDIEGFADWHYHVGDYAYADDGKEVNFESTWNEFQEAMVRKTPSSPFFFFLTPFFS